MLNHRNPAVASLFHDVLLIIINVRKADLLVLLQIGIDRRPRKRHHAGEGVVTSTLSFRWVAITQKLKVRVRRNGCTALVFDVIANINQITAAFESIGFGHRNAGRIIVCECDVKRIVRPQFKLVTAG